MSRAKFPFFFLISSSDKERQQLTIFRIKIVYELSPLSCVGQPQRLLFFLYIVPNFMLILSTQRWRWWRYNVLPRRDSLDEKLKRQRINENGLKLHYYYLPWKKYTFRRFNAFPSTYKTVAWHRDEKLKKICDAGHGTTQRIINK